jgi:hypothetical protein
VEQLNRLDDVVALARKGMPYREIARRVGLSQSYVEYVARKNGIRRGQGKSRR